MREIKFKAKRLDNGEWAYGYGVIIADDFCVLDKRDELYIQRPYTFRNNTHWFEFCGIMCDTNTLRQFTGLKDKNGRDVYEGDIIIEKLKRSRKDGERLVVCFEEFEWKVKNTNGATTSLSLLAEYHTVEIIGNIHDNPELLKSL